MLRLPDKPAYIRKAPGYAYLAVHYGWALQTIFETPREGGGGPTVPAGAADYLCSATSQIERSEFGGKLECLPTG